MSFRILFTGLLFILSTTFIGCATHKGAEEADTTIPQTVNPLDSILTPISIIEAAFANHDSNVAVTVKGEIIAILSDDTAGDRHQRFIIQLSNQQTVLIVHNIDIASRVEGVAVGLIVYVHGEYVWNDQGGLIHWTHHDPDGLHKDGWIVLGDTKYQ